MNSSTLESLPRSQRLELFHLLEERKRRDSRRKMELFYPDEGPLKRSMYPKHIGFFSVGKSCNERCALAANRVGKTEGIGAYETVCHLTGKYPHWWDGFRFDRPINAWASGTSNAKTKEIIQEKLLGKISLIGTGMIPGDLIIRTTQKGGVPDAIHTIDVKHFTNGVYDGVSTLTLKSYEQGREAFEGNEVDLIWPDEEPPLQIYFEMKMRTMSTVPGKPSGLIICTFTPLEGLTDTALLFAPSGRPVDGINKETGRYTLNLTWDDAPHLTEEIKKEMERGMPPYMRDARMRGIPQLGSGAIYPVPESEIRVKDFPIPAHWPRSFTLDVGWNFTAALWAAKDPVSKQVYIYSVHKQQHAEPSVHAQAIKARGSWIRGAIDPASRGRSQKDGEALIDVYKALGLSLVPANNEVEAGIYRVWQALSEGMLKVFESCEPWFEEFRNYRRDEKGKIVKSNDHLMDDTRYWFSTGEHIIMCEPSNIPKVYRQTMNHGAGAVFGGKR